MVSKLIIKAREFLNADFQVPSSKQYQFIQTFIFYRFYKPLGESIAPGCPLRTKHYLDPGIVQKLFKLLRVLRISIDDQVTFTDRKARFAIGQVSSNLQHPLPIWIGSASTNMDQTSLQLDHEKRVVGNQPGSTQHFRREEICRKQSFPVSC